MPPTFGFYFGSKFASKPGVWMKDIWAKKLEGNPDSHLRAGRPADLEKSPDTPGSIGIPE
jgi:hypothetical protein